jgi:hypothetical protein
MFTETEVAAVGHSYAPRSPPGGSILRAEYHRAAIDAIASLLTFSTSGADQYQATFEGRLRGFLGEPGDNSWEVRRSAVSALGAIGSAGEDSHKLLLSAVDDTQWQVRLAAIEALEQAWLTAGDSPAISTKDLVGRLNRSITDDDAWAVRRSAARCLSGIQADASEAVLSLLSLLGESKPPEVRQAGAYALARIGVDVDRIAGGEGGRADRGGKNQVAERIRGELMRAMAAPDRVVSRYASEALATMGDWPRPTLEAVVAECETHARQNPRLLIGAIKALGLMEVDREGPVGAEDALPKLVALCQRIHPGEEFPNSAVAAAFADAREQARESISKILGRLEDLTQDRALNAVKTLDAAIALCDPGVPPNPNEAVRSTRGWMNRDLGRDLKAGLTKARDDLKSKLQPALWRQMLAQLTNIAGLAAKYTIYILLTCAIIFYLSIIIYWRFVPLARIRASEWFASDLRFNVKVLGLEVNTGEILRLLTFTRFGGNSAKSLDAWSEMYLDRARKAYEDWMVEDGPNGGPDSVPAGAVGSSIDDDALIKEGS